MEDCYDSSRAVSPFESKSDEEQHSDERRNRDGDRLIAQLLARDLTDRVGAFDLVRCFGIIFQSLKLWVSFSAKRIECSFDLSPRGVYANLSLAGRRFLKSLVRHLNQELARLAQNRLNDGVFNAGFIDCSAKRICWGWLLEPHRNDGPALEIDAEVESFGSIWMELMAVKGGAHSGQHQNDRKADKETPLTEPVNINVVK